MYEHDINIDSETIIRVNKVKTDNFMALYESISNLQLPVSAMDIRKVQNVVREIYEGGSIAVNITEDIDGLSNDSKVVAIGTLKTIKYEFQTVSEMLVNYFNIIEEENVQILNLVDKQIIQKNQYFPIFAFSKVNPKIMKSNDLKIQQMNKIKDILQSINDSCKRKHNTIELILKDNTISNSNKINSIIYSTIFEFINLEDVESYLKQMQDKRDTNYRKLLCVYDLMKFAEQEYIEQLSRWNN